MTRTASFRRRTLLGGLAASTALLSCRDGCRPTTRADVGGVLVDDVSRLNACRVREVVSCASVDDVVAAVKRCRERGVPIIASGRRHSQGGQNSIDDGVVLDMTGLRRVVAVDVENLAVTVQAGASWDDVQRALNPRGLAVRTMQSSNIFTVGGSIGSNIHGRDVDDGVLFPSVRTLTLVDAAGAVRVLKDGDRLLPFVIGGYGLFGVVVEATLAVTKNALLTHEARVMAASDVPGWVRSQVIGTGALFIARPSIAPSSFLEETIVETWTDRNQEGSPESRGAIPDRLLPLGEEQNVKRDQLVFDASRASAAGKEARWLLQKDAALSCMRGPEPDLVTRNNAMRPPTTPLEFLTHVDDADSDIVQEYFVPVDRYEEFLASSRRILLQEKVNVLGLTIRYVKGNDQAALSFAPTDSYAFMYYTNQKRDPPGVEAAKRMTLRLVDAVVAAGGRHYLTYQSWPDREQAERAWPGLPAFFAQKLEMDPDLVFQSRFYQRYARPV